MAQPVYLVPSEPQRPRIVSQTILQDVVVLHVGEFPLAQPSVSAQTQVTPTPAPGNQQASSCRTRKTADDHSCGNTSGCSDFELFDV